MNVSAHASASCPSLWFVFLAGLSVLHARKPPVGFRAAPALASARASARCVSFLFVFLTDFSVLHARKPPVNFVA